jgi:hypothetical protein
MHPRNIALSALVSITCLACPGPDAAPPEPNRVDDCPAGSHADSDGECVSTLTVTTSSEAITPARDHHATFVFEASDGPYLYVVGGGADELETLFDDIQRAPIAADGSIGPFKPVGTLREPRAGHTAVLLGGHLVVAGGLALIPGGRASTASTIAAALHADGSLGAWRETEPLPMAVMHHTCSVIDVRMVCIGGRIPGNFTGLLSAHAEMRDDGTLSPFQPWTPLPASRGFHQAFVSDGALFIVGGLHRDDGDADFIRLRDVLRTEVTAQLEDEVPHAWQPAGEMPTALSMASAQVVLGRVYFAGGMDSDDVALDRILASAVDNGVLVGAQTLPAKLSVARMHVHQTPVYRRWMYSVGGRDHHAGALGSVDILELN